MIAETENLAFLEQGIPSFSDYLKLLKEHFRKEVAIVPSS